MKKEDINLDFVVRHYRSDRFSVDKGWRRLGLTTPSVWRRFRVAAAVGGFILLSATAAVIYRQYSMTNTDIEVIPAVVQSPMSVVKIIDFDNAALPEVIEKIEETYGVELDGVPDNAGEYVLTLHYEGNAVDLVETINEILDIEMSVRQ